MTKPIRLLDAARDEVLAEVAKYGTGFTRAVRAAFKLIAHFPEAWAPIPSVGVFAGRDEALPVRHRVPRAACRDPRARRGRDQATARLLARSAVSSAALP